MGEGESSSRTGAAAGTWTLASTHVWVFIFWGRGRSGLELRVLFMHHSVDAGMARGTFFKWRHDLPCCSSPQQLSRKPASILKIPVHRGAPCLCCCRAHLHCNAYWDVHVFQRLFLGSHALLVDTIVACVAVYCSLFVGPCNNRCSFELRARPKRIFPLFVNSVCVRHSKNTAGNVSPSEEVVNAASHLHAVDASGCSFRAPMNLGNTGGVGAFRHPTPTSRMFLAAAAHLSHPTIADFLQKKRRT